MQVCGGFNTTHLVRLFPTTLNKQTVAGLYYWNPYGRHVYTFLVIRPYHTRSTCPCTSELNVSYFFSLTPSVISFSILVSWELPKPVNRFLARLDKHLFRKEQGGLHCSTVASDDEDSLVWNTKTRQRHSNTRGRSWNFRTTAPESGPRHLKLWHH